MLIRKKYFFSMLGAAALLTSAGFSAENKINAQMQDKAQEKQEEMSQEEIKKVSEAFGHFIGRNLSAPGIRLDLDAIIKGMKDGAAGKPAPMTDKEYETAMIKLQETAFKKTSEENLKAANDYMQKNAKEPNVVVVEPGKLDYVILQQGNGEVVKEHNAPQIKYTGKYIDGNTFGSSEDAGGPITIPLDQTIPGFSKGIVGMKEGEKRRLYVHPDLGYGITGHLQPNALLIFDVEVVKANTPEDENENPKTSYLDLDDEDDLSDVDDLDIDDSEENEENR